MLLPPPKHDDITVPTLVVFIILWCFAPALFMPL